MGEWVNKMNEINYLYHYYEHSCEPFRTITALTLEEAIVAYTAWRAAQPNSGVTTPEWKIAIYLKARSKNPLAISEKKRYNKTG